jgi:hypothetical protein
MIGLKSGGNTGKHCIIIHSGLFLSFIKLFTSLNLLICFFLLFLMFKLFLPNSKVFLFNVLILFFISSNIFFSFIFFNNSCIASPPKISFSLFLFSFSTYFSLFV